MGTQRPNHPLGEILDASWREAQLGADTEWPAGEPLDLPDPVPRSRLRTGRSFSLP